MERLLIGAAMLAASACSSGVKPIGLHDSDVPLDARRFVADAQDAVSIARARRDDAVIELRATEGWRAELTNTSMWPKGSEALLKKLEIFADARVKMANLLVERAELQLELAQSKYTLSTAETAMRNDIAVYDLKPLRDDAEGIRREIERANVNVEDQRTSMDKLTLAWWEAYGAFTQGGKDTPVFYISPEILASAKERDERMQAARKAKAKDGKSAEKESDEKALPKTTEKKGKDAKSQPKEEKLELDL